MNLILQESDDKTWAIVLSPYAIKRKKHAGGGSMAGAQWLGKKSEVFTRFVLYHSVSEPRLWPADQSPGPASAVEAVWVMLRVRNDLQTPRDNTICTTCHSRSENPRVSYNPA